ncbi:MAG: protein-export chaperone SecB [Lachnospiraceae bacterium]|nr:protein-export chaperone SecB [Lachnospiraceae bacterium]
MERSKFQFLNPYLVEVSFSEKSDYFSDANNAEIEMQNIFKVDIDKKESQNMANVQLTLEINKEKENVPFTLKIKVASDFIWENIDEQTVDTMLNCNAPALLLGYMRPMVAGITNFSRFPTCNIPFVNFFQ